MPTRQGSIRLFQVAGITVYLHWLWFAVAFYDINQRAHAYSNYLWCALEVVSLFGIVLLHEFGHAFACRSVGGKAERIVLWPLGGVAFVSPPPRPGALLWSIVAGPLVNVVLAPPLCGLWAYAHSAGWADSMPDVYTYIKILAVVDIFLLVFNLLPIFPLDGGQILQSVLWFIIGGGRSLMVTCIIGFLGVLGVFGVALKLGDWWLGLIGVFVLMNCWRGFKNAQMLMHMAKQPRRDGFACPACHQPPVIGPFWRCAKCAQPFDIFETNAFCPHCNAQFPVAACPECGRSHSLDQWLLAPPIPVVTVAPPPIPTSEPRE